MDNVRKIDDRSKVERFEVAFNKIHLKLKELVTGSFHHAPYGELLQKAKKKRGIIHENFERFRRFGHLRNALVHEKNKENFYIAVPHLELVEEIERLCEQLLRPPLALSIASQPVTTLPSKASITEVLRIIEQKSFSQIPIYDDDGFKGLLTEGGIAKWFSQNIKGGLVSVKGHTAADILPLEKAHNVHFISRNQTIYDLEDVFEDYYNHNKKLEAILITESGAKTQKPIGIVTAWDLVRIDNSALIVSNHI